jgi:sporulation and spore germination protein/immunoglobulin-like protein involved in spore germination
MTSVDDRLRDAAASLGHDGAPVPPFKGVRQRARRRRMLGGAGVVCLAAVVALAVVTTTRGHDQVTVQTPGPTSTTPAPTATTTPPPALVADLSDVTVYLVANEHVVAAGRRVEGGATPEAAVRALLAGPAGTIESNLGFTTAIPAGTELHSVSVDGPLATVDLSPQFESGGGSLSMQARVAQVVFTVTQFPPIERVDFKIDGTPVTTIGGEGLAVDHVGRADFADVTPLILVESPTPGETVGAPLHVRGMSNTFEATVNYTLTDVNSPTVCSACAEGVIAEGFTTATAGSGTWGTFEFDIDFDVERAGPVLLSVYEVSAKDGTRVNEMTIPLSVQP